VQRKHERLTPAVFGSSRRIHVFLLAAVAGISIARLAKGKIAEGWDNWDQLGMLEQLGVYTAPEAAILAKSA
jgi:hypothetical protein